MASSTLAFIDQLQGANYSNLSSTNFEVGIVDPDSSGLTSAQISSIEIVWQNIIGLFKHWPGEQLPQLLAAELEYQPAQLYSGGSQELAGSVLRRILEPGLATNCDQRGGRACQGRL